MCPCADFLGNMSRRETKTEPPAEAWGRFLPSVNDIGWPDKNGDAEIKTEKSG